MKGSLIKLAVLSLGVTTLGGVTLAVASNAGDVAIKTNAADSVYSFNSGTFAAANGWTNGVAQTAVKDGFINYTVTGGGNNGKYYTSDQTWRFYSGGGLSISADSGYTITGVTSTPSVTFTNNGGVFSTSFTATVKISSISITYTSSGSTPVSLSSISVSGQTTEYTVGDTFSFDGTCTATYSDGTTATIDNPTVSSPDMSTAGTKTVTVSYTESAVTKETAYDITVSPATPVDDGPVNASPVTFDLTTNETTSASETELRWRKNPISMAFNKGSATVSATNYYPGTAGKTYSSTRVYKNFTMSFTADSGYKIYRVQLTAGSNDYASACAENTWTNATAVASGNSVTLSSTTGTNSISCTVGATEGFTSIVVYFVADGEEIPSDPEEPSAIAASIQEVYEAALALNNGSASTDEYEFTGTVSAMAGNSFYLQENDYGFLVYNKAVSGIAIGKKVKVTATIQKYNGIAETKAVSAAEVVDGAGETIIPVEFASASEFLAHRHNVLCSIPQLTEFTEVTKASSTTTGSYTAKFGDTTIAISVDKYAYTSEIGAVLEAAISSSTESVDITGAPIGYYSGANQITITSVDQIEVTTRSVYVESVSLNKTSLSLTAGGVGETLTASVTMSDSSVYDGEIEWSSSDTTVATVSNGVVTPVGSGTANIIAKVGTVSATCVVTVSAPAGTTYTQLAKYDFSTSTSTTTEITDSNVLKTRFADSFDNNSGEDIVAAVSGVSKVYQGYSNHLEKGIKFGTSSANGTFTFTTTSNVSKVVIETYSWGATDTLTVNGVTKTPGIVYTTAPSAATLEYTFDTATTSIPVVYAKRGFIKTITLYALDETPSATAETFATTFLSTVTCSGNGAITATGTYWNDMKTLFNSLAESEKSTLRDAKANQGGTTVQQAVARYDAIVAKYGTASYEDFMERNVAPAAPVIRSMVEDYTTVTTVVTVSAIASVTLVGGLALTKKKKEF